MFSFMLSIIFFASCLVAYGYRPAVNHTFASNDTYFNATTVMAQESLPQSGALPLAEISPSRPFHIKVVITEQSKHADSFYDYIPGSLVRGKGKGAYLTVFGDAVYRPRPPYDQNRFHAVGVSDLPVRQVFYIDARNTGGEQRTHLAGNLFLNLTGAPLGLDHREQMFRKAITKDGYTLMSLDGFDTNVLDGFFISNDRLWLTSRDTYRWSVCHNGQLYVFVHAMPPQGKVRWRWPLPCLPAELMVEYL